MKRSEQVHDVGSVSASGHVGYSVEEAGGQAGSCSSGVGDGGGRASIVGYVGSGLRGDQTGCGLGDLEERRGQGSAQVPSLGLPWAAVHSGADRLMREKWPVSEIPKREPLGSQGGCVG